LNGFLAFVVIVCLINRLFLHLHAPNLAFLPQLAEINIELFSTETKFHAARHWSEAYGVPCALHRGNKRQLTHQDTIR
jgi:hypothetical protein